MHTLSFELLSLRSWIQSPTNSSPRQLTGARTLLNFSAAFTPQKIPPTQSRRLSLNSILAVDLALQAAEHFPPDHIVFSSRFGEYNCSIDLISSIHRGEDTSPMKFSHSVHNTALGMYAILSGYHGSGLAMSDGGSSFVSGLRSCASYLVANTDKTVMYVCSDAGLHPLSVNQRYRDWANAVAVACILRASSDDDRHRIALEVQTDPTQTSETNQAREFLLSLFKEPGSTKRLEGRVSAKILL